MSKLWDALKKAEKENEEELVSAYEETFEETPEEFSGDLYLNIQPIMTEEYRRLFNTVRNVGKKKGTQVKSVLITAPRPGEGTSTIAASLSASIAADKKGFKVLLVDANLRNPGVHDQFGMLPAPGLVEVVNDYENRMKYFRASPIRYVPNFHILTAGNFDEVAENPVEVLEHENFETFFNEIRDYYNLIIIDAPAVNPYSDALSLARLVDGAIMVIDAKTTRWEVAQRAQSVLNNSDIDIFGVILNKRKLHIPKTVYKRL